jgi:hypothetical protein
LARFKSALPVPLRECTERALELENNLQMRATQMEEKREQVALLGAITTERKGLLADWEALKRHTLMYVGVASSSLSSPPPSLSLLVSPSLSSSCRCRMCVCGRRGSKARLRRYTSS